MTEIAAVSVHRLAELDGQGNVDLIDVRTPIEFRSLRGHRAECSA